MRESSEDSLTSETGAVPNDPSEILLHGRVVDTLDEAVASTEHSGELMGNRDEMRTHSQK